MKTLKKVEIIPIFVDYIPETLQENILYISEKYGVAIHLCLCGCKQKTVTPLGEGDWTLSKHENGKVSLSPSIGNFQFYCMSHYIITNNVANFV